MVTSKTILRAVIYTRVSTDEQAASGLGLDAQTESALAAVTRAGWVLTGSYTDAGVSGSLDPTARPALADALNVLAHGDADVLVVAKVDRRSRSVVHFAGLLGIAARQGWSLVALDLGVDTSTPTGELLAHVLSSVAQFERRVIGQRTKEALAVARTKGVVLGRPPVLSSAVVERIVRDRAAGQTTTAIAAALTAEGVPTARGGAPWHPSSVRDVERSQAGQGVAQRLSLSLPIASRRARRPRASASSVARSEPVCV